ncbi:LacI family DNA-binding transcriptional regulator [Agarivorans sp. Alg241-V36]|uniref:LacI family DNA-binding transcriptional regulator n=1 Tax=Agarivorans sp. Alg241-V36 TaxID=2305992 RepID=UPI0013D70644|nr:LacI family DNA-binding transcriptional regulator [Agarivorans sp. Alg241-V36]
MVRATLKTISEYTGLSLSTVSRAMKDQSSIKAETKSTVRQAAAEMGYRPNASGVGLRTGKNFNLCAVLPVTKTGDIIGDVGSLSLIEGFAAALKNSPYELSVLPASNAEEALEQVKLAVENKLCDGLIINLTQPQDQRVKYLQQQQVPFVTFGQTEMGIEHPFVDIDCLEACYQAALRLIAKGRKEIRLLSAPAEYTFAWHQYFGVRRAAMEHGLSFTRCSNVIYERSNIELRSLGRELVNAATPVDGIICSSEINAAGVLSGIKDSGKQVGHDVDLLVLETSDFAEYFSPPISGFRQDLHLIGRRLVEVLILRIKGEAMSKLQCIEKAKFFDRGR